MRQFFLSALLLSLLGASAPPPVPVQYTLAPEISNDAITAVKVEVRFRSDSSGTTDFGWDDGWAGERRLWQWMRDFHVAGATALEPHGAGHWRIMAAPGTELTAGEAIVLPADSFGPCATVINVYHPAIRYRSQGLAQVMVQAVKILPQKSGVACLGALGGAVRTSE